MSVVISSRNEAPRLEACLESLSRQRTKFNFEVIVVDQSSRDGSFALANKFARDRKNFFVVKERKPGRSSAHNAGARRARGQVLLFTDAGCRPAKGWVQEMAAPLLAAIVYPLAAVGGKTVGEPTSPGKPGLVERYLDQLCQSWERDRLSAFPAFLPWAPAGNFGVRKDVFIELGGFDPRWRDGAYDVDFCWRLALCGFVLGYAPKAEVHYAREPGLRGFLGLMQSQAFHHQSLLGAYERLLRLPRGRARQERMLGRGKRALGRLSATKNVREATYRGMDVLSLASGIKGGLQAKLSRARPDPKLDATRLGQTPPALAKQLPPGYAHLHEEEWTYWKYSPVVGEEGELVLFSPRRGERLRINRTSWKIWDVKSARGQSEDAALALGQDARDRDVLHEIDERTLDLRTRRLLP